MQIGRVIAVAGPLAQRMGFVDAVLGGDLEPLSCSAAATSSSCAMARPTPIKPISRRCSPRDRRRSASSTTRAAALRR
jgi:hypothetical protein